MQTNLRSNLGAIDMDPKGPNFLKDVTVDLSMLDHFA
jgi:hypothetical protein